MSSARSCNKYCLSLDNSSSNTSSTTVHLNRWSEVVPPKTALTFAALWDPEEGMVTFSGAALLETESSSGRPPHSDIFDDDYAQFVTLDRDLDGGVTPEENTATLATFQDVFKAFLRHTPWESREHLNTRPGQNAPRPQARASSTFDGLDIYSHDVQLKPRQSVQLSCIDLLDIESSFRTSTYGKLRLKSDLNLESCRSESECESNSGVQQPSLDSRFSTSTSNYVDATTNASTTKGVRISETFPIPKWTQPDECVSPAGSWPFLPRRRRLLRKRRPLPLDGDGTTTATKSIPATPRKLRSRTSKSSMSTSSPRSPPSSARLSRSNTTVTIGDERRGRFPRPVGGPVSSPPTSPTSPSKSPGQKLRFMFLQKRKSRPTSTDSDGWVCVEITPVIRQHFIPNLDDD